MSAVVWAEGQRVPAHMTRVVCGECGFATTTPGLGLHKQASGHETGYVSRDIRGRKVTVRFECRTCGVTVAVQHMDRHLASKGHAWHASKPRRNARLDRATPRFRCDACGHLSGDLDEAERHRRCLGHLLYSEKGVSEVWYYDLPNEAALFADA